MSRFTPVPGPDRHDIRDAVVRILCAGAAAAPALFGGLAVLCGAAAACDIYRIIETAESGEKKPIKVILLITLCAVSGAAARLILSVEIGLPLTVSAAFASVIMIILLHKIHLYLPPAGAMAILPMLIQESQLALYPLQVFLGITILTAAALILFRRSPSGT